jgi:hypothetical protein
MSRGSLDTAENFDVRSCLFTKCGTVVAVSMFEYTMDHQKK